MIPPTHLLCKSDAAMRVTPAHTTAGFRRPLLKAFAVTMLLSAPSLAQSEEQSTTTGARDAKMMCARAYESAQRARKEGSLIEAKKQAITCAQSTCPAVLSSDCVNWTQELESSIPSHVFELLDGHGKPVAESSVSVDGGEFVANSGHSIQLDPGTHRAILRAQDGNEVEVDFVSRAGQRNVLIQASLPTTAVEQKKSSASFPASVPTASWLFGGVGVIGLGAFGVLGALGVSEQNSIECSPSPLCDRDKGDAAKSLYLAADISLAVGVVALATGVTWWLVAPRDTTTTSADLRFDVTPQASRLVLSGQF